MKSQPRLLHRVGDGHGLEITTIMDVLVLEINQRVIWRAWPLVYQKCLTGGHHMWAYQWLNWFHNARFYLRSSDLQFEDLATKDPRRVNSEGKTRSMRTIIGGFEQGREEYRDGRYLTWGAVRRGYRSWRKTFWSISSLRFRSSSFWTASLVPSSLHDQQKGKCQEYQYAEEGNLQDTCPSEASRMETERIGVGSPIRIRILTNFTMFRATSTWPGWGRQTLWMKLKTDRMWVTSKRVKRTKFWTSQWKF